MNSTTIVKEQLLPPSSDVQLRNAQGRGTDHTHALPDGGSPRRSTAPKRIEMPWGRGSPQLRHQRPSLRVIMKEAEANRIRLEQEEARRQSKEQQRFNTNQQASTAEQEEELLMIALERSRVETSVNNDSVEEELLRLAMERSLTDLQHDLSASDLQADTMQQQQQQQQPATTTTTADLHSSLSASTGCAALDFALKVQAESETTERFVESPHSTASSRRRILIKPNFLNNSQRSLLSSSQRSLVSSQRSLSTFPESPRKAITNSGNFVVEVNATGSGSPFKSQSERNLVKSTSARMLLASPEKKSSIVMSESILKRLEKLKKDNENLSRTNSLRKMEIITFASPMAEKASGEEEANRMASSAVSDTTTRGGLPRTLPLLCDETTAAVAPAAAEKEGQGDRSQQLDEMQHDTSQNQDLVESSEESKPAARNSPSSACSADHADIVSEHDVRTAASLAVESIETPPAASLPVPDHHDDDISPEDAAAIKQVLLEAEEEANIQIAIRHADEEQEKKSLQLALQMLQEEAMTQQQHVAQRRSQQQQQQGNVRIMTRAELKAESKPGAYNRTSPLRVRHPLEQAQEENVSAGYRMNTSNRQQWARRDQNSIVGPNNEIRTKHDTTLQGQANAQRLGLDTEAQDGRLRIGNQAYNSFMNSVRRTNNKGVAAHGTGRAGADSDGTKGGAMDPAVRMQISRAINSGLIEKCNGVVNEGKEAVIYHANGGAESEGYDVVVKVFKRIQEFRGRGDYVDGDPRYGRAAFRKVSDREQLELWAEKEFRNLVRANRAGVPVPTPLLVKENICYMRFLGTDGWASPQLREINLRHGSTKWLTLYNQTMGAMKKLHRGARLVHGDLSEFNVMVVPANLVENKADGIDVESDELQVVLIDFGQAVDIRHPDAMELLERDIDRIQSFFQRVGVEVRDAQEALTYVTG